MRIPAARVAITVLAAFLPALRADDTARQIVERSVAVQDQNFRLEQLYTYRIHSDVRTGNKNKKETSEIVYIGGKEYRRLLERDGKPLPPDEARREQEKIDRAVAEANRLSPSERAKREAAEEKERAKDRERLSYIPSAYECKLLESTTLNGRDAFVVSLIPKPNYNGKYSGLLRNIKGKLWIDKADYHWIRVEAEALADISVGLVLARVGKGALLSLETTRVNEEVWLPKSFSIRAAGRLALLKKLDLDERLTFSDYRKFTAESQIRNVEAAR